MTKLRVTATVEQATPLLERYAELGAQLASIEAGREASIADTKAVADRIALPVIEEMQAIAAQLEPWWRRIAPSLLAGKRKSVDLGGCTIGTKAGRAKLLVPGGDDKAGVAALTPLAWAKKLLRVTPALDKRAIGEALEGKRGDELRALGFELTKPGEEFVLTPVVDHATMAKVAS